MQEKNIVIYGERSFEKVRGTSCTGCAFSSEEDSNFCSAQNGACISEDIVYIEVQEKELKYTVEEVLLCYFDYHDKSTFFSTFTESINQVKEKLKTRSDPNYQLYLKLKEKYADKD